MADQLATPEDLASLLQRDDIDTYKATMLVVIGTAIVQEATGGQRIVQVINDPFEIIGTTDSWLTLPQIPVTDVSSVVLDGTTLALGTDYKRFGNRLWRRSGWQSNWGSCNADGLGMGGLGDVAYVYNTGYRNDFLGVSTAEPSAVSGLYSHGFAPGSQDLQLGRGATLSICTGAYANPTALRAESIDDYSVTYDVLAGQLSASPYLKAALRKKYGRRAALVKIGT